MLIRRLLVLAYTRLQQRRILQGRETVAEIGARGLQRRGCGCPLARRGIEDGTSRVVGHLEAAPLVARDTVHERCAVVRPHGHCIFGEALIARGRAEKEDFLPRGADAIADDIREQRSEPRTAGEDEAVSRYPAAV